MADVLDHFFLENLVDLENGGEKSPPQKYGDVFFAVAELVQEEEGVLILGD